MKTLQILSSRSLATTLCLSITCTAYAGPPPPAADCNASLTVTTTDINFGSYVGGTTGTIIMDPVGNVTSPDGITLVGGGSTAATYTIGNSNPLIDCSGRQLTITVIPTQIIISGGVPTSTIIIDTLVTNIAPKTKFKTSDTNPLTIGATLHADAADPLGLYTGPFNVTFEY